MREIKFRGIGNARGVDYFGKFIYGDLIHIGGEAFIQNDDKAPDVIAIRVDPKTVGQFTGLNDKNGKEIYEGDIVRGPGFGAVSVYFDGGRFCLYFLGDEYWNEYADKIEVIGNIHENPELLEVTC